MHSFATTSSENDHNLKYFFLSLLPLMVLSSVIIYKKLKLNIAEHTVIAGVNLVAFLLLMLIFYSIIAILNYFEITYNAKLIRNFFYALGILNSIRVYFQAFRSFYSKWFIPFQKAISTVSLYLGFLLISLIGLAFIINSILN